MNDNVKSATTAGLLGIFLGAFGAHDWYLGNKKKGAFHVALAAGGILVFIIAGALLPAMLSWRAFYSLSWLVLILNLLASAALSGSAIWGFVEGIIILSQGDAGLARKGYAVANPNMGYNQGYNNQPMQGYNNGYNNMPNNGMNNMNNGYNNYGNNMPQNNMPQNNNGMSQNNMNGMDSNTNNGAGDMNNNAGTNDNVSNAASGKTQQENTENNHNDADKKGVSDKGGEQNEQ